MGGSSCYVPCLFAKRNVETSRQFLENSFIIHQFLLYDHISNLNIILPRHTVFLYPWANSTYYHKPISLSFPRLWQSQGLPLSHEPQQPRVRTGWQSLPALPSLRIPSPPACPQTNPLVATASPSACSGSGPVPVSHVSLIPHGFISSWHSWTSWDTANKSQSCLFFNPLLSQCIVRLMK